MLQSEISRIKSELSTILDMVPILIFYKDKDNKIIRANKAFVEAAGYTHYKELIGKSCESLIDAEGAHSVYLDDLEVLASGKTKKITECIKFIRQKESKWYETTKTPYLDKDGKAIGVVGTATDITEHVRLKNELKEANQKLINLVENMEDTFVVLNTNGVCGFSNKKWEELVEYTSMSYIKKLFKPYINAVLSTGKPVEIKDCKVTTDNNDYYYNFLFYRYNGGVAVLGRQVYDTPKQLSLKLSELNNHLDRIILESAGIHD